jgi:nicotinate-nucleotide pyrophosphorylase (carboxylating)
MQYLENLIETWRKEDPFYEKIFRAVGGMRIEACLSSRSGGYTAGIPLARKAAERLGVEATWKKKSGELLRRGEEIARFWGTPERIVRLENIVIGLVAKPSGIATAGREAQTLAGGKIRLVSGGWKKHPFAIKEIILEAVTSAGVAHRLVDGPFVYLDKNYVRIFGGIPAALRAAASLSGTRVIQLRGEFAGIGEEVRLAIDSGADVLMVDTGSWADLDEAVAEIRKDAIPRSRVKVAFGGRIDVADIPELIGKGVDILDIGSAILDAPWLDLSYDVMRT